MNLFLINVTVQDNHGEVRHQFIFGDTFSFCYCQHCTIYTEVMTGQIRNDMVSKKVLNNPEYEYFIIIFK